MTVELVDGQLLGAPVWNGFSLTPQRLLDQFPSTLQNEGLWIMETEHSGEGAMQNILCRTITSNSCFSNINSGRKGTMESPLIN